jgi:hypothetical protein
MSLLHRSLSPFWIYPTFHAVASAHVPLVFPTHRQPCRPARSPFSRCHICISFLLLLVLHTTTTPFLHPWDCCLCAWVDGTVVRSVRIYHRFKRPATSRKRRSYTAAALVAGRGFFLFSQLAVSKERWGEKGLGESIPHTQKGFVLRYTFRSICRHLCTARL